MVREINVSEPRVPILMYHYLGEPSQSEDLPYYVSARRFETQMRVLASEGYRTIDLRHLLEAFKDRCELPQKPIVITFDDGHRSFYTIGAPILRSFGFAATMFLITSKVGQRSYLTWSDVLELDSEAISFQSHSVSHAILTKASTKVAWMEIKNSKDELESRLGKEVYSFAYRGGHYDQRIIGLVRKAGYSCAVCSTPGFNDRRTNPFELRRKGIRNRDAMGSFHQKISPGGKKVSVRSLIRYFVLR